MSGFQHNAGERLRVELGDADYGRKLISCQCACPVRTDARGYVRAIAAGRFEDAYLIARGPNPFASICGRICGAPCEAACRRGGVPRVDADGHFVARDLPISIRALKRAACDQMAIEARPAGDLLEQVRCYVPLVAVDAEEMAALVQAGVSGAIPPADGQRVAIIGAGPAGLSAAHDLALMGFRPVVFESERVPAGMLGMGVPAYRLPRQLIAHEVAVIEALGVEIRYGVTVGKDVSLADLRRDHAAVILAVGAKNSRQLGLPGERGPRVYGGVDMLRAVALGESVDIGREAVVIGGGNVAYDVGRTVLRQIACDTARTAARMPGVGRVHLVSLETLEEMPADTVEIREGDEEGIQRHNGWGPVSIERDASGAVVRAAFRRCVQVYGEDRRFAPVFDDADRMAIPCDTVLLAVGQSTNLDFLAAGGADVAMMRPGWPKVDRTTLATTAPGVFVAGDLAYGTRLLIDAVASGKAAARSVYRFVTGRSIAAETVMSYIPLPGYGREPGYEAIRRAAVPTTPPERRLSGQRAVVEEGYTAGQAMREASRCLDCGVSPIFDGSRCVLCGGCVDVCPTQCLKLVRLSDLESDPPVEAAIDGCLERGADRAANSAILKDEERCIRCAACVMRCPVEAIVMERATFATDWRMA